MNMWTRIGLVALVAAALTAPASALTVDEFDQGALLSNYKVTNYGPAYSNPLIDYNKLEVQSPADLWPIADFSLETGLTEVLGGSRHVNLEILEVIPPSTDGEADSKIKLGISGGYLNFNNGALVRSKLTLTYDNNGLGLGGVDFTDDGASSQVLVRLLASDVGGEFTVKVWDTSGNVVQTQAAPEVAPGDPAVTMVFFNGFSNPLNYPQIDWTSVDGIQYELVANGSGDYNIDLVGTGTIPEPLTMLAVGSAVVGVGGYIRRRRRG